jgi:hypothetical protein
MLDLCTFKKNTSAKHDVSSNNIKSFMLLFDQRWCNQGWRRGDMGHRELPVSPPATSSWRVVVN